MVKLKHRVKVCSFRFLFGIAAILLSPALSSAQWIEPSAADLEGAWEVNVNQLYKFDRSPIGFGNVQEFKIDKSRSGVMFFKHERNTVWMTFEIPYDGVLLFEIKPYQPDDDYDWMMFQKTDSLAKQLTEKRGVPIRSNNSKNDKNIESKTGIQFGFENLYEKPGLGQSYSRPLEVKEGEKYFLIVDNIRSEGKGFDIKLEVSPKAFFDDSTVVHGVVTDKATGKPLRGAKLYLEDDSTAFVFSRFTTDTLGRYKVKIPIYRPLNLTASFQNYLFSSENVEAEEPGAIEVNFALDSAKKNNSINLFNIHFPPNSAEILPSSIPDLDRILQFLIEYPDWKIKIIGHSNNNVWANQNFLTKLSMKRAIAVKTYLVENGIDDNRLSCIGMGGKKPLIVSNDMKIAQKNLRVEIKLSD